MAAILQTFSNEISQIENYFVLIQMSLKFVPKGPIDKDSTFE